MEEKGGTHKQQGGRISDARGRKATMLDPVAMSLLRQREVIEPDTLRAIAAEEGVRITRLERAMLGVGMCGALLVIALFTTALITGDVRAAPYAKSASLIFLCSIPWVAWYSAKLRRFDKIAAAMLKHLRCPHCGYDLRMLPRDTGDGATVCPECGCAWDLSGTAGAEEGSHG